MSIDSLNKYYEQVFNNEKYYYIFGERNFLSRGLLREDSKKTILKFEMTIVKMKALV